jgi:hypothetical protein
MKTLLPASLFLLAAAGATFAAQRIARPRRDGDAGGYWSSVSVWLILLVAPPVLLSGWLEVLWPDWYQSGRHLFLDLTGAFGWSLATCFLVALAVPLALWLALLGLSLHGRFGAQRWLAAGVGLEASRRWLLLCTLPVLAVAVFALPRLGGGPGAYPAASWALCTLLGLSLLGVASSAGEGSAVGAAPGAKTPERQRLVPWPQAMQEGGIGLRPLVSFAPSPAPRPPRDPAACGLAERLELMGARRVAPELVEAVASLLEARPAAGRSLARVVAAADGCGQEEVVALAAHLLGRRYRAHSLVITAAGAAGLAARLGRWLPAGGAAAIERHTEIPPAELLWVIDAATLSDRLLPQLRDPQRIERLGLVVWWDVHDFSGVLAANLWAISRRLHRLLEAYGRPDLRTLALVRRASHADAQLTSFVQRLLPLPLDPGSVVEAASGGPRPVELHLLESYRAGAAAGAGEARRVPLALAAARVSLERGWPTCCDPLPELGDQAEASLRELRAAPSGRELVADAAAADVRIHPLRVAEVLALPEIFGQGGRAGEPDGAEDRHHVGLTRPEDNPYAGYLLEQLAAGSGGFGTSRRLVWAQARGELVRRHLLLALSELPDTRGGLLRNFFLEEDLIRETLEQIAREGNLTRREVRCLDRGNRLVSDHQYQARRPADRSERPLTTLGNQPIDVRDPAAGGGVRLRVDRERLTVEAYPHRIFLAGGRRYRVDEWSSVDEVASRGWLSCTREDSLRRTWRRRHAAVFDVVPVGAPVTLGSGGKSFTRLAAELCYEEEVTGILQLAPGAGLRTRPELRLLDDPIRTTLATRALLLAFRRPAGASEELAELGPISLCEALRHVLPVHLGVEEDALELVPLLDDEVDVDTLGVAIVDMYPGGIGLVDAVQNDDALVFQLLRRTRDWLAQCRCRGGRDCVLDTPSARAAAMDQLPDHRAAVALLKQAV